MHTTSLGPRAIRSRLAPNLGRVYDHHHYQTEPYHVLPDHSHRVHTPPPFLAALILLQPRRTNTPRFSAGVTGLSCAIQLQEAGHAAPGAVTLIARDFPTPFALVDPKAQINFTSPWGGAHNRWVPPPTDGQAQPNGLRDHRLALATFRRMRSLQESNPEAGITFMKGIEYLEDPAPEYRALAREGGEGSAKALGLEGFRVLDRSELPDDKVSLGIEYDTWCVNPMVYCSFLLNRFVFRGGRILRREISRPEEVFEMRDLGGPVKAVVNASGMGFNDPKSYIIRGMPSILFLSSHSGLGES